MMPSFRINWLSLTGENKQTVKIRLSLTGENKNSVKINFPSRGKTRN